MRPVAALALALTFATAPAVAQDGLEPARNFDVMAAVNGVWAYDPLEMEQLTDYACGERPMAMRVIDGGARLAAMRAGDEVRYALVLDVRNDYPIGPALSVVWGDAPQDVDGDLQPSVLVMDSEDGFYWIEGPELTAFQDGEDRLMRGPRRVRCPLAPASQEAAE